MDWAATVRKEAETNSIIYSDQLARKYNLNPIVVSQALARQERRKLIEHIGKKIYFNRLASDANPRELVNVLRSQAYISLETALREYGITTQSPRTITCVTTERPKEFRGRTIEIAYRGISRNLYWGYVQRRTRYGSYQIAEPEKALLDFIYLSLQDGIRPALDELDFDKVSRTKLLEQLNRFPKTVSGLLLPILAEQKFAS
jgi:predicted transcriptional regulator of viral defense system